MEPKVEKVFGVQDDKDDVVLSYVERPQVNTEFVMALDSTKHIIVYGSTKQGKTSLRKRHLNPSQYVMVVPGEDHTVGDMYESVVRQENIPINVVLEHGTRKKILRTAQLTLRVNIPMLVGGDVKIGGGKDKDDSSKYIITPVDYNLNHAQDVCELLKKINFSKSIVLENFHYLRESVQKTLAVDLKVFLEYGIRFIILGIWRERNRLGQYNGDLLDRMKEIPVDPWDPIDLDRVAKLGMEKLNIYFGKKLYEKIKEISFGSIGVFQELCKEVCIAHGIKERQHRKVELADLRALSKAIERKVKDYGNRHVSALRSFVQKRDYDKRPRPNMSFFLMRAIIDCDFNEVLSGIHRENIEERICAMYKNPDDFRKAELGQLLHTISVFQSARGIQPPLFDYDQTSRILRIIDSTFHFYLRHAKQQMIDNVLEAGIF